MVSFLSEMLNSNHKRLIIVWSLLILIVLRLYLSGFGLFIFGRVYCICFCLYLLLVGLSSLEEHKYPRLRLYVPFATYLPSCTKHTRWFYVLLTTVSSLLVIKLLGNLFYGVHLYHVYISG